MMEEQKEQDPFNETQTIWKDESLPSEASESTDSGSDHPARASIQMKKPSIDFNAVGTSYQNKTSGAAKDNDSKGKKGAGKMIWGMAASLRTMVTKRFTSASTKQAKQD